MSDMKEMIVGVTSTIFKDLSTKELIDESENGEWSKGLWEVLTESELVSIGIPENLGGAGGDFEDAFSIIYLAGKYAVPLPLSETILAKGVLADLGQQTNSDPTTFSFEPENNIRFEKSGSGYSVSGKLVNVPWGRHSKFVLAMGKLDGSDVVGLLPLDQVVVDKINNLAGEPRDVLMFEEVFIEELILHTINAEEFKEKMINLATLSRIAMMAGAIEKVMELSTKYVKEREQFGRPLHRFQMVQQLLATLAGETVITISSMNNVIKAYEEDSFVRELPYARIRVNEAAGIVAHAAHQAHGAFGVTYEHSLHQYTRRLWAWRDEFGAESVWIDKMVTYLLDFPDENLWETMTKKQ